MLRRVARPVRVVPHRPAGRRLRASRTAQGRAAVHSPHHAVTASAAKRPSPGVAHPKSHESRSRRHWIASLC